MRIHTIVLGLSSLLIAACSGNAAEGGGEGDDTSTVVSPLEATGKVDFYARVTGQKQGDFKNESTVKGHEKDMPAFRFSMGTTSPTDPNSGLPTGKTQFAPLTFTKAFGASDPQFLNALATNENLKQVVLTFVKSDASGKTVNWQTVTLTNARVIDLQRATMELDDAAKTSMLADTISLSFQKLELKDLQSGITSVIDRTPSVN